MTLAARAPAVCGVRASVCVRGYVRWAAAPPMLLLLLLTRGGCGLSLQPQLLFFALDDGFHTVRTALRADIDRRVFCCSKRPWVCAMVVYCSMKRSETAFTWVLRPPCRTQRACVRGPCSVRPGLLTKVIATTTAVMQLYQRGLLGLHEPVWTILALAMLRTAKTRLLCAISYFTTPGCLQTPTNYWDPKFGCPQTVNPSGPLEDFSCQRRIYESVLADADQPGRRNLCTVICP